MVLGPHTVETPEAMRARRAPRFIRNRKAVQSGEGVKHTPSVNISTSGQRTIVQQNPEINDHGRGQLMPRPPKKPKNLKTVPELQNYLQKVEAELQTANKDNEILVDTVKKLLKPSGKVSVQTLADQVTSWWTERDIIFEELKNDLSKARQLKQEALSQSRRDAEALKELQNKYNDLSQDKTVVDSNALRKADQRVKELTEERDSSLKQLEKLRAEREALIVETAVTNGQENLTELTEYTKQLEKLINTKSNEIQSGETTIFVLEGEKVELVDGLEEMKKELKKKFKEIADLENLQNIFSEVRSIANLPVTVSPQDSADKLREAWKNQETRYQTIRTKEKRKETESRKKLQEAHSRHQETEKKYQKALEQLNECMDFISVVRVITGITEDYSPDESAKVLREVWQNQKDRNLEDRRKLEEYIGKSGGHVATNKRLMEIIEKIVDVMPGSLEIEDLIEKLEDLDMRHALKISNLKAKIESNDKASKEQIQNIRDICRTTAKEMNIKFEKKTKIPEFLALFRSEWGDQDASIRSLYKQRDQLKERIDELEITQKEFKEEMEHALSDFKDGNVKKKKKKLLTKMINKITRTKSDEKQAKIKDQKESIRRLEAIQDAKYKQDREILALNRDIIGFNDIIKGLKKQIDERDETIIDLNYSLDQERNNVQGLHDIIRVMEERDPMSPRSLSRDEDSVLMDLIVMAKHKDVPQDYRMMNLFRDLKPYATTVPTEKYPLSYLAAGAFGEVALTRLVSNNKCVVVKQPILPTGCTNIVQKHMESKGNNLRTMKEALIHQLFSENPLIPSMIGLLQMPFHTCLVLEFIGDHYEGKDHSLLNVLKQTDKTFPFLQKMEMLNIAEDVVRAVGALHEKGLLHNDIKTNNILLEKREGRFRGVLIDFGQVTTVAFSMRKQCPEDIQAKYEAGDKYRNVAPEIILRGRPSSIQSDIYSLGIVFGMIGRYCCIKELVGLAEMCCQDKPAHRPQNTTAVIVKLRHIRTCLNKLPPLRGQPEGNEQVTIHL